MRSVFAFTIFVIILVSFANATSQKKSSLDQATNYQQNLKLFLQEIQQIISNPFHFDSSFQSQLIINQFKSQFFFELDFDSDFSSFFNDSSTSDSKIICSGCNTIFGLLKNMKTPGINLLLKSIATFVCTYAKMYPYTVCRDTVNEMEPYIFNNIKYHFLDEDFICPFIFPKACPSQFIPVNITELVQQIISDKPDKQVPEPTGQRVIKVLHISDVHTDLEYQPGAPSNCNQPECCRTHSTMNPNTTAKPAGQWGSLADCDLPPQTFEQFVQFLLRNFDNQLAFALWTGDNTSHDIWHQSTARNIENTKKITASFKKNMPGLTFYTQMGNHESYPVNVYDYFNGDNEDRKQINDEFSQIWEEWIGADAATQYKEKGFYTTFNSQYNLRIFGLNSQACNDQNWYLLRDPTDPFHQLEWLRAELYKAEQKGELVYLIQHFLLGSCLEDWSQVYNAIIDRFSFIIRGQFAGHTHSDMYQVFKDHKTNKTISVQYMPGSLTTYSNRNPGFRVFEIDADTMLPLNYHQYRLYLDKWNEQPNATQIEFDHVYDFLNEYNLENMWNYDNIDKLTEDLRSNLDIYKKFVYNYEGGRNTHVTSINIGHYCDTNSINSQQIICQGGTPKPNWQEQIMGPWLQKKVNIPSSQEQNPSINKEEIITK